MIGTRHKVLASLIALAFVGLLSVAQVSVNGYGQYISHRAAEASGPFPAATAHRNRQKFSMRWLVDLSGATKPAGRCIIFGVTGTLFYESGHFYRAGMTPQVVKYVTDTALNDVRFTVRGLAIDDQGRCLPGVPATIHAVRAVIDWPDAPIAWNPHQSELGSFDDGLYGATDPVIQVAVDPIEPAHGQLWMSTITGTSDHYTEGWTSSSSPLIRFWTRRSAVTMPQVCLTATASLGMVWVKGSTQASAGSRGNGTQKVCLQPDFS